MKRTSVEVISTEPLSLCIAALMVMPPPDLCGFVASRVGGYDLASFLPAGTLGEV